MSSGSLARSLPTTPCVSRPPSPVAAIPRRLLPLSARLLASPIAALVRAPPTAAHPRHPPHLSLSS